MAAVTRKCFDPALDQRSNQLFPVRCLTCGGMVGRHQLEFEELVERQQEEKTRNDHLTVLSSALIKITLIYRVIREKISILRGDPTGTSLLISEFDGLDLQYRVLRSRFVTTSPSSPPH